MQGIKLSSMEASDMLDIIHVIFEDENSFVSEEQMKSRLGVRARVYEDMYKRPFKYKYKDPKKSRGSQSYTPSSTQDLDFGLPEGDTITPFNPREKQPTKPEIPFTKFDPEAPKPFGNILDAPLG